MIMNDKQKNIIDKLNKDNESLNQGHKSMVEYSKGMICIGLFEYIKLDRDKSTFKSHRDFSSEIEITFKHF